MLTVSSKAMFSIATVTTAVSILMSVGAMSGICAPIRSNWLLSPGNSAPGISAALLGIDPVVIMGDVFDSFEVVNS